MADEKGPFAPITKTWDGQGKSLEQAIENAWEQAKKHGGKPGTYRILDISFLAENPISEYGVIIGRAGGYG